MVDFREDIQLREGKRRDMQEKLREIQDKRREIIEETIRRDFEEKERNDTQHRSPNLGGEGRQGSYESEKMAYKNPTKPSSHPFDDKHLLDAHPSCLFGARMKEAASDTLVHRYTPVGVTREPVREQDTTACEVRSSPPGLRLPTKPNSHDANTKDGKYNSGHSGLLGDGSRTSDTLVHKYTPVGVKREPVGRLHRHSSTEDNAMSFSKPDTILNVAYLNKPSVDPAANRTKAVAVVANTEATKSQHRSLLNVDQTDSTSDDVPQRLTTKEVSEMLPEVRPKRSTFPTPIPLVARTINAESKRFQWERGRSEEAKFEEYDPWMHPGRGTPDRQGNNVFNDYNTENRISSAQYKARNGRNPTLMSSSDTMDSKEESCDTKYLGSLASSHPIVSVIVHCN